MLYGMVIKNSDGAKHWYGLTGHITARGILRINLLRGGIAYCYTFI